MDQTIKPDEFLETVDTSTEYPSDADVAEAKNLTEDVTEKHRKRTKKFAESFKRKQDGETEKELKEAKKKLKDSLNKSRSRDETDDAVGTKRRRHRRPRPGKGDESAEGVEKEEREEENMEEMKESVGKPRKVDRAAIAAAVREKHRKEKESLMLQNSLKESDDKERLGTGISSTDRPLSTRFDLDQQVITEATLIPDEPAVYDKEIVKPQFKVLSARSQAEPDISWETLKQQESITDKQTYDFFCKQWPDHPSKKKVERDLQEEDGEQIDRRPSTDMKDSSKLIDDSKTDPDITDDYYGGLKSSYTFLQSKAPVMATNEDVIDKENELDLYYYPGDVDETFMYNKTFRNLEEEGLYVGKRPYVNIVNERRLESRIQREKNLDWFGEDGRVKIQPDPLKEIPFRPLMWDEQFNPMPDYLKTDHFKPIVFNSKVLDQVDVSDPNYLFEMAINIDSIEFSHHHLYTEEHVYAQRLKQLFMVYEYIVDQEALYFFEQRIMSLKHAISHLQERHRVHEVNGNQVAAEETLNRIANYRQEIRNARVARNNEEAHTRRLITSIIKTWKIIKQIRLQTGLNLTGFIMKIKKEATDAVEDQRIYDQEIGEQVEEEREFFNDKYQYDLREYNEKLTKYESQQGLKAEARARQEFLGAKRENGQNDELDENELNQSRTDVEILSKPDLICPQPPDSFDETQLRQNILTSFEQCRRLPGEPKLNPIMKSYPISDNNLSREEVTRRNLVLEYQYYGELFFNHKKVVTTATKHLNQDFVVKFGEVIPIVISQYPEIITFKIYEKYRISSKLIVIVELDVPPPQLIMDNKHLEMYNFQTNQTITHNNYVVGSGINKFSLESLDGTPAGELINPLFTTGFIMAKSSWQVNEEGMIKIPQAYLESDKYRKERQIRDPLMALGLSEILELQRKQEWKNIESHLDPNDPRDMKVIKALHTNDKLGMDPGVQGRYSEYFRLNPGMDEFDIATEEEIDRSLRFRMILLRSMNVPDFYGLPIPAYDDKVPMELIREYDNRKSTSTRRVPVTGFEARKLMHQEFVEKIREEVLMKFRNSLLKRPLIEMVREEEIPTISDIFPKIFDLNRFNRPLQRVDQPRKAIPVHNIYEMNVDILIVIKRASNLPIDIDRRTINPFVQVHFQNSTQFTDVMEGPNPAWDMELRLPFKPPVAVTSLDTIKDSILINVYDQQIIDLNRRAVDRATTVHERYERHCIGSLEIPFNTLYLNSKIEGNFRLNQPSFLQGYEHLDGYEGNISMLSIFITMDPDIHPPQSLKERFTSMEEPGLLSLVDEWYNSLNNRFPKRFRRATVVNMRCQETMINRYIAPLAPPEEFEQFDINKLPLALARFVSLIPFMNDTLVFPGISDIWSTCDQFLKMLIGDEEEHAVLLCNYFLHINQGIDDNVYLCLGKAIPEGNTAYVFTRSTTKSLLWNASTGTKFAISDPTCPMFCIGMLVNRKNVWANIQQNSRPCELTYDLTNRSHWECLLKNTDIQLQTVQPEAIIYQQPFLKEVEDYQLSLETQLRNSIMDWRLGLRTSFVLGLRRDLVRILTNLENNCGQLNDDIRDGIKTISKGYRVFGFPINLPYMDLDDVLDRVKATGIHLTAAVGVEFCVAVYVKAYANSVMSIWIYVASLQKE